MRNKPNTHTSGSFGERKVHKVFGLKEPEIEIKSVCKTNYRTVIKLSQLEENYDKYYYIIVYDRERKYITRGPRKGKPTYTLTIAQAYKKDVEVLVILGSDLIKLIEANHFKIKYVLAKQKQYGYFKVYVTLSSIRTFLDDTTPF